MALVGFARNLVSAELFETVERDQHLSLTADCKARHLSRTSTLILYSVAHGRIMRENKEFANLREPLLYYQYIVELYTTCVD